MARKKKKTLEDIIAENQRLWDQHERTHQQMNTTVSPQQMLDQGHQIIAHQYNQLHQGMTRIVQLHQALDQFARSLDQQIRTMEYHFTWLKEEQQRDEDHS
tara:strand:- start:424 stop:726 length:303 start_codon:yes stop_codon:yes gene_type:complete